MESMEKTQKTGLEVQDDFQKLVDSLKMASQRYLNGKEEFKNNL